jgi:hypothetical protein
MEFNFVRTQTAFGQVAARHKHLSKPGLGSGLFELPLLTDIYDYRFQIKVVHRLTRVRGMNLTHGSVLTSELGGGEC